MKITKSRWSQFEPGHSSRLLQRTPELLCSGPRGRILRPTSHVRGKICSCLGKVLKTNGNRSQ